mmetsp:Transcript_14143/g.31316  ORF Transcript_14143/g.31316 Transcript_14143/m.31316 type:complete len:1196 (-) Transcript_14143:133-3720(-)
MGRKVARTPATGPDVKARGLDTETLGRSIGQCLSVKGFCVIDPEVDDEYLDSVLGDISAVDEQGRFASVPAQVVEGLLGKEGSYRVADIGVSTEDAYASLFTESFMRDGAALRYFDAEFTRYANLLSPHLERAKIEVSARSSALLHEVSKPKGDGPALTEEVCSKWLKLFFSHRLMSIWCLGPESGELQLQPWAETAEPMKVTMRPGRLVIVRADALYHRFSSLGCAYCLTCFYCNLNGQDPVSPSGFALKQWAAERMERFKQSSLQEKRYMEMPRDWEEKINREKINTQRVALRTACVKEPGTEDPLSWALSFNSGPDYAVQVPMMRWQHDNYFEDSPEAYKNGKTDCMHGVYIEGIELFDCMAFRISRAEASGMDPGHRLTLETGYEALVRDGYKANTLMNSRGGVYVANPPPSEWSMTPKDIIGGGVCGGGGSIACGRFSFVHGLKGPCISIDVEGASSLVAVNYASTNLSRTGNWDPIPFALCNSWNLQLSPASYIQLSACRFLSPQGRTFAFDASASGYIRGDCVASMVLKALEVEDGEVKNEDQVLGHLAGSATNQSGRRVHMAAPDCLALQEVIHEVVQQTQISPLDVDAVESYADGKILDDCLEATALARAYRPQGTLHADGAAPLGIVSSKSGAGNQLEAMGLSQIIKVILGARVASIQPTPHLRIVNPHVDLEMCDRNAMLPSECISYRLPSTFTGILNRSIGGTNCHCIMFAKVPEQTYQKQKAITSSKQELIQPLLFWPSGGGELAEEMLPKMGYSIMGTFNRWRPQPMENKAPGVYVFTIILSENRWERFQIALDGEPTRVLHPVLTEGDKCCPVAGPEAALQVLSWQIDGRPKGPRLVDAGADDARQVPGGGWQAIAPDALRDVDADLLAVPGDRFRIRLQLQGRWRMVDWEKLPQAEKEDTPAERAFEASLTGLVGTYQVAGSWNLFDLQAMKCDPLHRHRHCIEVLIARDGEQHFHLLRNEDRNQVIGPPASSPRPGSAILSAWNQRSPLNNWVFHALAGDVFKIEFERTAEQMQVTWSKIRTGDSVPEELIQMHLRKRYMVRFCFDSWSNDFYQMSWAGEYYQLFVELNELAKASFLIYEEGNPSRCLHPSIRDAHPLLSDYQLQGPTTLEGESLFWTIGASEDDHAALGRRYELRLRMDEEGKVPMKVDWVPVKSTKGLEEAAAKGHFVGWLPAILS